HAAIAGSPDARAQVSASSITVRASIPARVAGIVAAIRNAPIDAAQESRKTDGRWNGAVRRIWVSADCPTGAGKKQIAVRRACARCERNLLLTDQSGRFGCVRDGAIEIALGAPRVAAVVVVVGICRVEPDCLVAIHDGAIDFAL